MNWTRSLLISVLLAIWCGVAIALIQDCPQKCKCSSNSISCRFRRPQAIAQNYTIKPPMDTLDYSGSKLETLTQLDFDVQGLSTVRHLFLNDSNVAHVNQYTFYNFTNLESLDLSENILELVPARLVLANKKILALKLSMNIFRKTPELISESLQILDLSGSHLEFFGEKNVINLPSLRYLFLHQNKLQFLSPNTFSLSHHLLHVDLSHNNWKCNCSTAKLFDNLVNKNLTDVTEPIRCRQAKKKFIDIYTKEGAVYWQKYCVNSTQTAEMDKIGTQNGSGIEYQNRSGIEYQNGSGIEYPNRARVEFQNGDQIGSQNASQIESQNGSQIRPQNGSQIRSQNGSQSGLQVGPQSGSQIGSPFGIQATKVPQTAPNITNGLEDSKTTSTSEKLSAPYWDDFDEYREPLGGNAVSLVIVVVVIIILIVVTIVALKFFMNHRKKVPLYRGLSSNSFEL